MITPLGIFLKNLREKNDFELLGYMAKKLGISPSKLSAYESGKEVMPEDVAHSLSSIYGLTPDLREELFSIIHDTTALEKESKPVSATVLKEICSLSPALEDGSFQAVYTISAPEKELEPVSSVAFEEIASNLRPMRGITQDDINFLANLRAELVTQPTDGNRAPRFWTVKDTRNVTCWSEEAEWYDLVDSRNGEYQIVGRLDYDTDAGELDCIPMKEDSFVSEETLFITKREAQEHIARNSGKYNTPHTYVQTAEDSPQFARLLQILQEVDWRSLTSAAKEE